MVSFIITREVHFVRRVFNLEKSHFGVTFLHVCVRIANRNINDTGFARRFYMSAIWGAIHLKQEEISESVSVCMRKAFNKCKIDRYEEIKNQNVYLGCGIQYFVPEAVKEQLPYTGEGIYFDADVVLDNRQELYGMLGMTTEEGDTYPDGKLLFEIYKRKGKECLNALLGAYAFVWYDAGKQKVEMVLDAVGNRCLYYTKVGDVLYFSSLLEPLVQLSKEVQLNDRWFTDFLGSDSVVVFNDTESTPFQNIYRIAPAQYICIHADGHVEKEIYWNPFHDYEEYSFESDEEYKKRYLELWDKAVKDTLRAEEHSILLSGGLDSNAVAAIAAPYLKEKKKQLYSYTAIPVEDYQVDTSGRFVDNEAERVKKTAEYFGNIETTFLRMNDVEPWEKSREEISVLEFPYKAVLNSLWIEEAMRQAYEKGSRVLLTGSYGNISISYGGGAQYINVLYQSGQKQKMLEEIPKFSRNKNISAQRVYKLIEKQFQEEYVEPLNMYGASYVNRSLVKTDGTHERMAKEEKERWESKRDYQKSICSNIDWIAMRQIGEMKTKQSLATGVLLRDPTGDKRVLEFCIRLPIFQYCRDGVDRRLVRVYMKDLIPKHIIEERGLGRQSVDLKCRMAPHWNEIRETWLALYDKYADSKYVMIPYARQQLLDWADIDSYEQFDIERHMFTIFVLQYEGYIKNLYGRKEASNTKKSSSNSTISVAIYVQNDEKQVSECIKCVTEQTYHNLEILLFADESQERSQTICNQWVKQDARIKVVHQKDKGECAAFQKAVGIATGDWLTFLRDSDYIEKGFYQKLYNLAKENEVEVIGYQENAEMKERKVKLYFDKDILYQYLNGNKDMEFPKTSCNYLYKTKLLQGMVIGASDRIWNLEIMEKAQKCMIVYEKDNCVVRKGKGLQNVISIDDIIAENKLKLEMARKYFPLQMQEWYLLNYYRELVKLYRTADRDGRRKLKEEWQENRTDARRIIIETDMGRKCKVKLYLSTYIML